MAMIAEVLHRRTGEVLQRVRLDALPLTVGRGLDNALILDDPYVDAHHARLLIEEDGSLVLEDLGSVNRLATASHARAERVRLPPGSEIRIGRTTLRFRDEHAPVAPALPLHRAETDARESARRWHERTAVRLGVVVVALALAGVGSWIDTVDRSGGSTALLAVVGIGLVALSWAGVWAVAARAVIGQFRFLAHISVVAWVVAVTYILGYLSSWGEFLLPDNEVVEPIVGILGLGIFTAMIAQHLADASAMSAARRWRAGAVAGAVVLALGAVFVLVDDDEFTDVPEFSSVIKSAPARLVPTQSVEEFAKVLTSLKVDVDSLVKAPKP